MSLPLNLVPEILSLLSVSLSLFGWSTVARAKRKLKKGAENWSDDAMLRTIIAKVDSQLGKEVMDATVVVEIMSLFERVIPAERERLRRWSAESSVVDRAIDELRSSDVDEFGLLMDRYRESILRRDVLWDQLLEKLPKFFEKMEQETNREEQ
jgi:hypothetical protein